jgi:hypothetical protein
MTCIKSCLDSFLDNSLETMLWVEGIMILSSLLLLLLFVFSMIVEEEEGSLITSNNTVGVIAVVVFVLGLHGLDSLDFTDLKIQPRGAEDRWTSWRKFSPEGLKTTQMNIGSDQRTVRQLS